MKRWFIMLLGLMGLCTIPSVGASSEKVMEVVDEYKFTMVLRVPRTYDNMQSLGYRKYQSQRCYGVLRIVYSADGSGRGTYLEMVDLYNKTHKVGGKCVEYLTIIGGDEWPTRIGYIGSNKTSKFYTPYISFSMDANPSYNVGDDEPDNTLVLRLSGSGTSKLITWNGYKNVRIIKKLRGKLAGDLGCGCMAYGHVSCTRTASWYGPNLDEVVDIASIDTGYWMATWKRRYMRERCDDEY